ncbi:MAG TPA: NAD(P)-dependent oxidoreductase [Candidatus Sumerlaeota bacterium]|nr:NAD(P)-dependent oxidoreductase [Candidatus Sumerlaeota bacterium]
MMNSASDSIPASALVLGASGMIGLPLALALAERGARVYGAARFSDAAKRRMLEERGVAIVPFDVLRDDPAALPDVAALFLEIWDPANPKLTFELNVHAVGRVVERYAGAATIVNGGTINVYGAGDYLPREDSPCQPDSPYGLSRFVQEQMIEFFCRQRGGKAIHVRYAHTNSASRGMIHWMASRILGGESLGPHPDRRIQVIALEDAVRVTAAACSRAEHPTAAVNCCHPREWGWRELAEEIHRRLGRGSVVFDAPAGGVATTVCADAGRMVEWFGPPQVTLEAMIERVVRELS